MYKRRKNDLEEKSGKKAKKHPKGRKAERQWNSGAEIPEQTKTALARFLSE